MNDYILRQQTLIDENKLQIVQAYKIGDLVMAARYERILNWRETRVHNLIQKQRHAERNTLETKWDSGGTD